MIDTTKDAHGKPGIPGKWTTSAKSGLGKSLTANSEVSFTLSHGILNEVYYPREDNACVRDMELLVSDGKNFFSEEKRDTEHTTTKMGTGIPAYTITNSCNQKVYTIEKEVLTDPLRNTLLQKIKFNVLKGKKSDYSLFALLAPHIGNKSSGNTAWIGEYKGVPMLFAKREEVTLALACSLPWKKRSVGFVGVSDGYTDIKVHKKMQWEYSKAEDGNVALTGEIDFSGEGDLVLALSFGKDMNEAGQYAHASLNEGFERSKYLYLKQWENWHKTIHEGKPANIKLGKLFETSIAVMRMHESFKFAGAVIASLSIPWGNTKGDGDIGGYHLVWPRDLVECSTGFLAFKAHNDAFRVLNYLMATQEEDGHWPQNMWLEGTHYWNGMQLDQIAFPILLIGRCVKETILDKHMEKVAWVTARKAVTFLLRYGPLSPQERWEEESGISVSTIATCIAGLIVAAELADYNHEPSLAKYCRETADAWNDRIDDWLYVSGTPMAEKVGVDGYYIRINPKGLPSAELKGEIISLKNRPADKKDMSVNELVSVDALCLVRFGLRKADDPKMLNTVKVIDAILKVDTKSGPAWHRYNNDGYGEHADGSAFDGTGIGRVWPLLTGERAHYEIAAGNFKEAEKLMKTMENFSSHELLSEQVWDTDDIPDKELFNGKHSGSAIPLVWAHAEYVKLCASLSKKEIFDLPDEMAERYIRKKTKSKLSIWRFMLPLYTISKGKSLRIETAVAASVRWSADEWYTTFDSDTIDTGFGLFYTDIDSSLIKGDKIDFTFYWKNSGNWENQNFSLKVN